jgi:hypothetical protein
VKAAGLSLGSAPWSDAELNDWNSGRGFYFQDRDGHALVNDSRGDRKMRFMMIMIPEVYSKPVPTDFMPDMEAVKKMGKYNEELQKAGVLLGLDGLTPPSAGARVSFAGGRVKVVDGPFAEAKEAIGGYWMIQAKSRDEAIEWAKRCPAGANDVIEIRQVHEPEDFGPELAREESELTERVGKTKR